MADTATAASAAQQESPSPATDDVRVEVISIAETDILDEERHARSTLCSNFTDFQDTIQV